MGHQSCSDARSPPSYDGVLTQPSRKRAGEMEIGSAISGILGIKTLVDGLVATHDKRVMEDVKSALSQRIFEVQQSLLMLQQENMALIQENAAVVQENRELKEQIRDAHNRKTNLQGYELFQPVPGVFVYATQPLDGARPQPPYLCQTCYDNGAKSTLAFKQATSRLEPATLHCPANARHALQLPRGANWDTLVHGVAGG